MIITIYSNKGGVGKTPLSHQIAKELDYKIVTNDDSYIVDLENAEYRSPITYDFDKNTIFDLGGWVEAELKNIFTASNLIIIPFTNDLSSIKKTNTLIKELNKAGFKTLNVLTKYTNKKDIEEVKDNIDFKIHAFIPETKLFKHLIKNDLCIDQMKKVDKVRWKNHIKDFKELIEQLKGKK